MPLNIRDPETERLASEVAALTGETKTAAVRTAPRERRDRLALRGVGERRSEAARRYLAGEVWPTIEPERLGEVPSKTEQDQLLGYDDEP